MNPQTPNPNQEMADALDQAFLWGTSIAFTAGAIVGGLLVWWWLT